jgi:hypothetical protein
MAIEMERGSYGAVFQGFAGLAACDAIDRSSLSTNSGFSARGTVWINQPNAKIGGFDSE